MHQITVRTQKWSLAVMKVSVSHETAAPPTSRASEHVSAYCFSLPNSFTVTIYTAESDLALWAKYVSTYKDFDSSLVSCSHNFEQDQQLFSAKQPYKVQSPACSTAQPQSDTDRKITARNIEETNDLEETKPGGETDDWTSLRQTN